MTATVRRATEADVRPLSLVLARAFREDPVHRWMFPTEGDWALRSERFFRRLSHDMLDDGGVTTNDALEGGAIWFPPQRQSVSLAVQAARTLGMLWVLGRHARRVGRGFAALDPGRPTEPHWYLGILGTDPRHQGRGVASALLAPTLADCDAEGLPAYLESSREENLPFYMRHGFEVVERICLGANGPPVWRMRRGPRS